MSNEYITFVNGSQPALNEDNMNLLQQLIKNDIHGAVSGDTLPIGAILPYPSATIPTNWLLCNGAAVSRTTYSDLFNVIGTIYGAGDGSTTFNLPDLRGKHPMGYHTSQTQFNALGKTGGERTHTMTINELVTHNHNTEPLSSYSGGNTGAHSGYGYEEIALNKSSYGHNTTSTGGGQAFNVLDPYVTANYIIKAGQTAGVVAQVANTSSNSQTDTYSCNYINTNYLSVTELYKDDTGSTGSVTLSETANNFKYIEIIYGADGYKYSTKVRPGDSFATGVQSVFSSSSAIALYTSNWTISGTSITFSKASNKYLNDSNSVSSYGTNAYVRIYEVLGYK